VLSAAAILTSMEEVQGGHSEPKTRKPNPKPSTDKPQTSNPTCETPTLNPKEEISSLTDNSVSVAEVLGGRHPIPHPSQTQIYKPQILNAILTS